MCYKKSFEITSLTHHFIGKWSRIDDRGKYLSKYVCIVESMFVQEAIVVNGDSDDDFDLDYDNEEENFLMEIEE